MTSLFLQAVARAVLVLAAAVWATMVLEHLLQIHLPRPGILLLVGVVAAGVAAWIIALRRRPSEREAAVAIDDRLELKEKFSTALYARPLKDPFAVAAVRDAEQTADQVSLYNRFPIEWPLRPAAWIGALVLAVLLTAWLMPNFDLLGVQARQQRKAEAARTERVKAERAVKQALVEIDSAPRGIADAEAVKMARRDLTEMLKRPIEDPAGAQQKAQSAHDAMEALRQQIKQEQQFANAANAAKALAAMDQTKQDDTPVGKAQNAMAKGDFSEAVSQLKSAVDQFDKSTQKEKQQTAAQMAQLAQQIAQHANDPAVQQQIQQQLQQMGANQQQAQQLSQLMQQAASGDQKAQQQIQQAAKQLAQQMNQKQGGSAQQQQQVANQIANAMKQMQQQANGQAQAQQMAQAAQQLAQAMAQSAQQSGKGQQGSQSTQQQPGQAQSGQQSAQQQMAQAGQTMQQQLQQLQAMANDQQAVNAGQQNGSQPGQSGQNGNQNGNLPGQQGGGQWAAGDPANKPGQGFGGPGQAAGARPAPEEAPYAVKQELSQSQTDENGKILASSFVKAGTIKGDSKVGLSQAVLQEQQDATDEVGEDRIPRSAAQAVKEYFQTIKEESK